MKTIEELLILLDDDSRSEAAICREAATVIRRLLSDAQKAHTVHLDNLNRYMLTMQRIGDEQTKVLNKIYHAILARA